VPCPVGDEFIRGDCNNDMGVNVADAVFLLGSMFVPGEPPLSCRDAGDINDDGGVNIADAIFLLGEPVYSQLPRHTRAQSPEWLRRRSDRVRYAGVRSLRLLIEPEE